MSVNYNPDETANIDDDDKILVIDDSGEEYVPEMPTFTQLVTYLKTKLDISEDVAADIAAAVADWADPDNTDAIDPRKIVETDGTEGQVVARASDGSLEFVDAAEGGSSGASVGSTVPTQPDDATGAAGTSTDAARADHKHPLPDNATDTDDGLMSHEHKVKLDGIAEGAEVNVQADWDATTGDAQILNKPTIPTVPDALTDAEIKTQYEANADTNAFTDADHTKLDAIEDNATADQTGAEIKTAYEAEDDTNAFTDDLKTKLDGIAEGAEVNVQADWDATTGDAQILNKPTIPTVPDALTDAEIKTQYENNADTNAFTDADHTKLDAIEANATADQTGGEISDLLDTEIGNTNWRNISSDGTNAGDLEVLVEHSITTGDNQTLASGAVRAFDDDFDLERALTSADDNKLLTIQVKLSTSPTSRRGGWHTITIPARLWRTSGDIADGTSINNIADDALVESAWVPINQAAWRRGAIAKVSDTKIGYSPMNGGAADTNLITVRAYLLSPGDGSVKYTKWLYKAPEGSTAPAQPWDDITLENLYPDDIDEDPAIETANFASDFDEEPYGTVSEQYSTIADGAFAVYSARARSRRTPGALRKFIIGDVYHSTNGTDAIDGVTVRGAVARGDVDGYAGEYKYPYGFYRDNSGVFQNFPGSDAGNELLGTLEAGTVFRLVAGTWRIRAVWRYPAHPAAPAEATYAAAKIMMVQSGNDDLACAGNGPQFSAWAPAANEDLSEREVTFRERPTGEGVADTGIIKLASTSDFYVIGSSGVRPTHLDPLGSYQSEQESHWGGYLEIWRYE